MPERRTPTLDDFVDLAGVVLDAPEEPIRHLLRARRRTVWQSIDGYSTSRTP